MAQAKNERMGGIMVNYFEAKKHAYRQTQDGIVISFTVHPNDMGAEIATAALGTRYMVAFCEIGDDEAPKSTPVTLEVSCGINHADYFGQCPGCHVKLPDAPAKPKRKFSELSLPEQAGIRCADSDFFRFMIERYGIYSEGKTSAEFVRKYCGITSRSALSTNHDAANKWRTLEIDYQNWLTTEQYAESVRR